METSETWNTTKGEAFREKQQLAKYQRRCSDFLFHQGIAPHCHFKANKQGRWFVLEGRLDSFATKVELRRMVPRGKDRKQWIVDRLHVRP